MNQKIGTQLVLGFIAIAFVCYGLAGCSSRSTESAGAANREAKPSAEQPQSASTPPSSSASSEQAAAPSSSSAQQPGQPSPVQPAPAASLEATQQPPARTFKLAAGRAIPVYTTSTISTKENKAGERFTATLAAPIVDGDWVIANKGATVEGVIVNSDPGGRVKGVASMTVRLDRLTLADGRNTPISTSAYVRQARATKKKDAAKIGIGAGAGALIGAIAGGGKGAAIGAAVGGGAGTGVVLATRGDPAVIPGESRLNFRLTSPVTITRR